jgi:ABC-type antimicrobial peptide transport system permease subunit
MESENKVLFYSEELNEDIHQNTKILNSKKIILENNEKEQINQNSYNTIVDTKDYLGCVNNNCSAINCNCSNSACHCSANIGNNSYNNSNNNIRNNSCNSNNNNSNNSKSNIEPAINNYITKLFDFLFVLLIVGLLILIIYKRESLYLLYVLVITLLYIFIKFLMLSNF